MMTNEELYKKLITALDRGRAFTKDNEIAFGYEDLIEERFLCDFDVSEMISDLVKPA